MSEFALLPGKVVGMGSGVLALDTILSATFYFSVKWSSDLQSNKARDLLRFLLCRLYDEGRGQLVNAQLTLAQTTLAKKLGMSRQWVGELVSRLEREGWLEHYSPALPDGTNGSTIFRVGRQLKRLLVMLSKSQRGKTPAKSDAKKRWRFSPHKREKQLLLIHEKENQPPSPTLLQKIPILQTWMQRGEEKLSAPTS
jgi:DNA-binding Lrp family transcriptional regulator